MLHLRFRGQNGHAAISEPLFACGIITAEHDSMFATRGLDHAAQSFLALADHLNFVASFGLDLIHVRLPVSVVHASHVYILSCKIPYCKSKSEKISKFSARACRPVWCQICTQQSA